MNGDREDFPDRVDEARRQRFEEAWSSGRPLSIEQVMADFGGDDGATLEELVHIEMELAWKHPRRLATLEAVPFDEPPDLETYMHRFPALDRPSTRQRLAEHLEHLRRRYAAPAAPTGDQAQAGPTADHGTPLSMPPRIGPYRVERQLGAGGMGVVYLARQESPRRLIAVKVLNPLLVDEAALRRFRHEAEVLGRLRHPGIAQILEAGVHQGSEPPTPYIAMEYVRGEPLTDHVRRARPAMRERLELFLGICEAVEHAHQQGIIHRDLKPANLLVEPEDGGFRTRVLDFGLARLLEPDLEARSLRTGTGQLLGTLPYMSPEQVSGMPGAVDRRSDVYALGTVLYELLAERPAVDVRDLTIDGALRRITDRDPVAPGVIDPALRGDLDTIVTTALQKDRERRYQSAAELAADIWAFLDDRPIAAHPPSTIYQLRKFARRHRAVVAAGAVAVLTLLAGTVVATWQAVRAIEAAREAEAQRDEAERQRRVAAAVNEFLAEDLLASASPFSASAIASGTPARELTMLEVLDQAGATVAERFVREPAVEASVRLALGRAYLGLGRNDEAMEHFRRADELLAGTPDADELLALEARYLVATGHFAGGEYDRVEPMVRDVIERRRRVLGEDHPETLDARVGLGVLYVFTRRLEEAEAIYRDVLERRVSTLGDDHPDTVEIKAMLAELLRTARRNREAEPLFASALEHWRRRGGFTVQSLAHVHNFALLYSSMERYDAAESLRLELVEQGDRLLGKEHPTALQNRAELATIYRHQGRLDEAEALQRSVLEARRRVLGEDHPWTLSSEEKLAEVHLDQGRLVDAERHMGRAARAGREVLAEDFWYRGVFLRKWGHCLTLLDRCAEAEAVLLEAHGLLESTLGADHRHTRGAIERLAELCERCDRPEEAERWRARLASRASSR